MSKKKSIKAKKFKKKRVNYPWIKKRMSCALKYFLAYHIDSIGFKPVLKGNIKYRAYVDKKVLPLIHKKFPRMYSVIRKYYKKAGRKLSKADYDNLLFMRIRAMYEIKDKKVIKKSEHPELTAKKKRKAAGIARILLKKDKSDDDGARR